MYSSKLFLLHTIPSSACENHELKIFLVKDLGALNFLKPHNSQTPWWLLDMTYGVIIGLVGSIRTLKCDLKINVTDLIVLLGKYMYVNIFMLKVFSLVKTSWPLTDLVSAWYNDMCVLDEVLVVHTQNKTNKQKKKNMFNVDTRCDCVHRSFTLFHDPEPNGVWA